MPEEEKPPEMHNMDVKLDIDQSHLLSPHIYNMCQGARETTFAKESDLQLWAKCKCTEIL